VAQPPSAVRTGGGACPTFVAHTYPAARPVLLEIVSAFLHGTRSIVVGAERRSARLGSSRPRGGLPYEAPSGAAITQDSISKASAFSMQWAARGIFHVGGEPGHWRRAGLTNPFATCSGMFGHTLPCAMVTPCRGALAKLEYATGAPMQVPAFDTLDGLLLAYLSRQESGLRSLTAASLSRR
jgi:hypothetical protein